MKKRMRHSLVAITAVLIAASSTGWSDGPAGERPKIGVVLGGGGALGMAHVGVLRVLEEMKIPIDYIGGTSMGAIISGLYASGMSPDEIETFLMEQDWWDVMNDHTPRRELEFRRKQDDQRYFVEFGWRSGGVDFGRGTASGQKFNNLLETETLRTLAVTNFDELPIPYRAVATDLRGGKSVVLDRGNLAVAMRASMAVPAVFTPVEWGDYILADGGLMDNIPVSVVRGMGADIIIAVDVGGSAAKAESSNTYASIGQILGRTYSIMQRPEQEKELAKANIVIVPDLVPFSASDFQKVAQIVPQGDLAARAMSEQLKPLVANDQTFQQYLKKQRRSLPESVPVSNVVLTGNRRVDSRVAWGRVNSKPGQPLSLEQVRLDLLHLYGLGEFEQIRYSINPGPNSSNTLAYAMNEKSWGPNYFHIGLRLQSDFDQSSEWAILLNFRKTSMNALSAEWNSEFELGSDIRVFTEFYQPLNFNGVYFVDPSIQYKDELTGIYSNDNRQAEYDVGTLEVRGDVGVQLRSYAELRGGPFWRNVNADVKTGSSDLPTVDDSEGGWAVKLAADRLDRTVFSTKGYEIKVQCEFIQESMGSPYSYEKFAARYDQSFSWGNHILRPQAMIGTDFDSVLPGYNKFSLGGAQSFAGLADGQLRGDKFGVASLGYLYRLARMPPSLGRAVYSVLRFDTGNMWSAPDNVDTRDLRYGGLFALGADTMMGPMYFGYGLADRGSSRFYFSLGSFF